MAENDSKTLPTTKTLVCKKNGCMFKTKEMPKTCPKCGEAFVRGVKRSDKKKG